MEMEIEFVRSPESSTEHRDERRFKGRLYVMSWTQEQWGLEIAFSTNPMGDDPKGHDHSRFRAAIGPRQFEKLARIMREADPQAAIRAFGAAMRDVEIARAPSEADT
jgi:hypothetical protein